MPKTCVAAGQPSNVQTGARLVQNVRQAPESQGPLISSSGMPGCQLEAW
jgi:hypothetical protein